VKMQIHESALDSSNSERNQLTGCSDTPTLDLFVVV
jgi:hypothetical protein